MSLRTLPRAQQVDGVVKSMLGGQVSAETREVLMSGENPMLASAARRTTSNGMAMIDSGPMMGGAARRSAGGREGRGRRRDCRAVAAAQLPGLRPAGESRRACAQVVGSGARRAGVSAAIGDRSRQLERILI